MKIVVIGGYGHIGSYLVPQLVKENYDVIAISRGKSKPYVEDRAWEQITHVSLDREKEEHFAKKIAELNADVVVDLINFDINETKKMVAELRNTKLSHYLYCSSVWAHGRAEVLPVEPNVKKEPLDAYGIDKYKSEMYLKEAFRTMGFPATIIMPGQISGPGWTIMNPQATTDLTLFQKIADGEEIILPNFGMETLHHVHAHDVARMFVNAIQHRNQALGESFHAVAEKSLTLYGYALTVYRYFNQESKIKFLPWDKWCAYIDNDAYVDHSYHHLARSGQYSIENAKKN
jgi:nucleoside-diphosphate-sugar epimerase